MGILQQKHLYTRVPIGRITFHFQTSLYRRRDDIYEKVKEYLKIGETKEIIEVKDDYIEIQDGYFIKNIEEPQYTMTFGEIVVKGSNVKTCSKNGVIFRSLKPGLKLKVSSIVFVSRDVTVYAINDKEFISSDENIQYVMGVFEFNSDTHIQINGQSIKCKKGDTLQYQTIEGNCILLLDGNWLDISVYSGTLHGC